MLCFIHTYTCYSLQSVYEKEHYSIILSWGHLAYYYVSQTMYFSINFMNPFFFYLLSLGNVYVVFFHVYVESCTIDSSYATAEMLMMPLTAHYTTPLRASIWTIDLLLPLQISVTISIHHRFLKLCLDITFFYI